jgi:fumarylacetoacetase
MNIPADHPFPVQNLPFGAGSVAGGTPHCISIIGDHIINLAKLESDGAFANIFGETTNVFSEAYLNRFMGLGKAVWVGVR